MISPSELMIRPNGRIYHLDLLPEELASKVILVGDPARVSEISHHFDSVRVRHQNREYFTHTGFYKNQEISVISTGIGHGNIDIVLNELDALANINLESGDLLADQKTLEIIRIGTSGSLQEDIPINSFLLSEFSIDLGNLLSFYEESMTFKTTDIYHHWSTFLSQIGVSLPSYIIASDEYLNGKLRSDQTISGITLTSPGFYGPQSRMIRLAPTLSLDHLLPLTKFTHGKITVTNFEMESAPMIGLAKLMGHRATTICLIAANRFNHVANTNYQEKMEELILYVLDRIS